MGSLFDLRQSHPAQYFVYDFDVCDMKISASRIHGHGDPWDRFVKDIPGDGTPLGILFCMVIQSEAFFREEGRFYIGDGELLSIALLKVDQSQQHKKEENHSPEHVASFFLHDDDEQPDGCDQKQHAEDVDKCDLF